MQNKDLTKSELKTLYKENSEFADYVKRYCTQHNININTAFTHKIINYAAQNILGTLKVWESPYV